MAEISPYQRRILDWMQEHHPDEWVGTGGVNLQVCRGLAKDGLTEIRGTHGAWQVRLTEAGRRA